MIANRQKSGYLTTIMKIEPPLADSLAAYLPQQGFYSRIVISTVLAFRGINTLWQSLPNLMENHQQASFIKDYLYPCLLTGVDIQSVLKERARHDFRRKHNRKASKNKNNKYQRPPWQHCRSPVRAYKSLPLVKRSDFIHRQGKIIPCYMERFSPLQLNEKVNDSNI